ncbi:hypothetical protein ACFV46_30520 [Streptomyces sp. NPDC059852]|uniref:hypothetical protein n=1 Tax=Streptomyces sp. NPDC059852 TaxID=3346972 RepID=UPI003662EDD5
MTSPVTDAPDSSPRRALRSKLFLGVTITAILAGGGGFAAGHAAAGRSTTEDCAAARTVESRTERKADRLGHEKLSFGQQVDLRRHRDEWVASVRTHAYVITQNPTCFSAQQRARAQATLDEFKHHEGS